MTAAGVTRRACPVTMTVPVARSHVASIPSPASGSPGTPMLLSISLG